MWTKTQLHLLFEVLYEGYKKSKHILIPVVWKEKKRVNCPWWSSMDNLVSHFFFFNENENTLWILKASQSKKGFYFGLHPANNLSNHYPEQLLFMDEMLRIVIWHISLRMEKLSEIKPPLRDEKDGFDVIISFRL